MKFPSPIPALILCFTLTQGANAQTIFLDKGYQRTQAEMAAYTLKLSPAEGSTWVGIVKDNKNISLMSGTYVSWNDTYIEHGRFTYYYPDGTIECTGEYDRGVRSGIWKRFNPDGTSRQDRFYPPEGAAVLRRTMGIDKG